MAANIRQMPAAPLHRLPQAVEEARQKPGRKRKPLAGQLPLIRAHVENAFRFRPDSAAIAERFQVPRVDVVDAVLYRLHTRVQGLEASSATRHVDGFGRPTLSVIERRPPGSERGRSSSSERKGAA